MKSITVAKSARFGADIFVLFVSVPQLKCWGSPDVGGEGSMCNHFPTPVCRLSYMHTYIHTHIHTYIHTYITYILTYIQTDRQTDRRTDSVTRHSGSCTPTSEILNV